MARSWITGYHSYGEIAVRHAAVEPWELHALGRGPMVHGPRGLHRSPSRRRRKLRKHLPPKGNLRGRTDGNGSRCPSQGPATYVNLFPRIVPGKA